MSENILLKKSVKSAVSLNMGKNLCSVHVLNIITYKNGEYELQST